MTMEKERTITEELKKLTPDELDTFLKCLELILNADTVSRQAIINYLTA